MVSSSRLEHRSLKGSVYMSTYTPSCCFSYKLFENSGELEHIQSVRETLGFRILSHTQDPGTTDLRTPIRP